MYKIRKQILAANEEVKQAHKSLVMGEHLTEEEFWAFRKDLIVEEQMRQERSLPSAMIADVRANKANYEISPSVIHSIFVQYPGVKRAFQDYVPDRMTEEAFWLKFFQSQFFHRDRTKQTYMAATEKDMFDEYDQQYQEEGTMLFFIRFSPLTFVICRVCAQATSREPRPPG